MKNINKNVPLVCKVTGCEYAKKHTFDLFVRKPSLVLVNYLDITQLKDFYKYQFRRTELPLFQGINILTAPINLWKRFGSTLTVHECYLQSQYFHDFDANAFYHSNDDECIMLQMNLDQDLEVGKDVVYVLGEPWESDYPYYCKQICTDKDILE